MQRHKSAQLALMRLFTSNKGGNTSQSTTAEDGRGDLNTPPCHRLREDVYEMTWSTKNVQTKPHTNTKASWEHRSMDIWYKINAYIHTCLTLCKIAAVSISVMMDGGRVKGCRVGGRQLP